MPFNDKPASRLRAAGYVQLEIKEARCWHTFLTHAAEPSPRTSKTVNSCPMLLYSGIPLYRTFGPIPTILGRIKRVAGASHSTSQCKEVTAYPRMTANGGVGRRGRGVMRKDELAQ